MLHDRNGQNSPQEGPVEVMTAHLDLAPSFLDAPAVVDRFQ